MPDSVEKKPVMVNPDLLLSGAGENVDTIGVWETDRPEQTASAFIVWAIGGGIQYLVFSGINGMMAAYLLQSYRRKQAEP